ncbi:MAG: hypothetical protein K2H87_06595, partial [Duncaniella sp.]|nr:hypothetical protein [Duncaniella sp.]
LVKGITLSMAADGFTPGFNDFLSEFMPEKNHETDAGTGELAFRIFDPAINRSLSLRSARRVPLTRQFIEALEQQDISFTVEKA